MRRTAISVFVLATLLVAGWSGLWWALAGRVEQELDAFLSGSATGGLMLACDDRRIDGYPFRIDVACGETSAADALFRWQGSAAGLRTAALLYRPGHVVAELDAPARFDWGFGAPSLRLDWTLARLSVNLRPSGLNRLSAAIDALQARAGDALLFASHAEAHARPAPKAEAAATDVAFGTKDLRIETGVTTSLPFDIALTAQLDIPPQALALDADDIRRNGLSVSGIDLRVAAGDVLLAADGALQIAPDGLPSGTLEVRLVGGENAEAVLSGLPAPLAGSLRTGVGAVLALGRPERLEERPARRLTLSIENGLVRSGFVTLGQFLPLF